MAWVYILGGSSGRYLRWIVRRFGRAVRAASSRSYSNNQASGKEAWDRGEKGDANTRRCTTNWAGAETEEESATRNLSFTAV